MIQVVNEKNISAAAIIYIPEKTNKDFREACA